MRAAQQGVRAHTLRARFILLGTNHPLHFGAPDYPQDKVEAFRAYLIQLCRSEGIKVIAEEANDESLQKYSVPETVASKVARDEGLDYKMVDLTTDERSSLGIADSQLASATFKLSSQFNAGPLRERLSKISNQVREGVWVARTLTKAPWPALLIMGATHVRRVEKLVRSLRQKVIIAHPDYEP